MKKRIKSFYNKASRIYLVKGVNHSYRMIGVRIAEIDVSFRKVGIKQSVQQIDGKKILLKLYFQVDRQAIITGKDNAFLDLSDIKVGNKVIIDFVKIYQGEKLIKGIRILR